MITNIGILILMFNLCLIPIYSEDDLAPASSFERAEAQKQKNFIVESIMEEAVLAYQISDTDQALSAEAITKQSQFYLKMIKLGFHDYIYPLENLNSIPISRESFAFRNLMSAYIVLVKKNALREYALERIIKHLDNNIQSRQWLAIKALGLATQFLQKEDIEAHKSLIEQYTTLLEDILMNTRQPQDTAEPNVRNYDMETRIITAKELAKIYMLDPEKKYDYKVYEEYEDPSGDRDMQKVLRIIGFTMGEIIMERFQLDPEDMALQSPAIIASPDITSSPNTLSYQNYKAAYGRPIADQVFDLFIQHFSSLKLLSYQSSISVAQTHGMLVFLTELLGEQVVPFLEHLETRTHEEKIITLNAIMHPNNLSNLKLLSDYVRSQHEVNFDGLNDIFRILASIHTQKPELDQQILDSMLDHIQKNHEVDTITLSQQLLRILLQSLDAQSLVINTEGHSIVNNTYSQFLARRLLMLSDLPLESDHNDKIPVFIPNNSQENTFAQANEPFLQLINQEAQFVRAQGRSLIFKKDNGKYLVIKMANRKPNDVGLLAQGKDMMQYISEHYADLELQGTYPENSLLIKLNETDFPAFASQAIKEQTPDSNNYPAVIDNQLYALAYEISDLRLLDYAHQSNYKKEDGTPSETPISHEDFLKALDINLHDFFILARHGIVHTALIDLFHHRADAGSDAMRLSDDGRFIVLVDLIRKGQGVFGTGLVDNWLGASEYCNIRLAGPADWDDFNNFSKLTSSSNEFQHPQVRHLKDLNIKINQNLPYKNIVMANYLAEYLLSHVLIYGRRMRDDQNWRWNNTGKSPQELREIFKNALVSFIGNENPLMNTVLDAIDWDRMAAQMAFFMAESNDYVSYLRQKDIPDEVFPNQTLNIQYEYDKIPDGEGWSNDPNETGFYMKNKPYLGLFPNGALSLLELTRALHIIPGFMIEHALTTSPISPNIATGDYSLNIAA